MSGGLRQVEQILSTTRPLRSSDYSSLAGLSSATTGKQGFLRLKCRKARLVRKTGILGNAEAVMTARYTCSNAAACCPPLPRLRRDSRRTDVPGMRIRVVRLHQPLDSRA